MQQEYTKRILSVLVFLQKNPDDERSLEFYRNAPESTDPEDLITGIYAPLEPAFQEFLTE